VNRAGNIPRSLTRKGNVAHFSNVRVLIIGCGYVGTEVGLQLVQLGHEVAGLRRSAEAAVELASYGIRPLCADITDSVSLRQLTPDFDWVVNCAASTSGGGLEDYRRVYLEGTRNLVRWLRKSSLLKFAYTSSTSVYGQNDGSWVDESCPTEPASPTGKVLAETEQELIRAHRDNALPAVVLRVAGIYGPGRGYYLRQLKSGEARIEGTGARFINMVHRDDVAGAIIAALEHGKAGSVYNVCDQEPVPQAELYGWLAKRLGLPVPSAARDSTTGPGRRHVTNKKISSRKLREELGYRFRYPTFRDGYG